MATIGIFLYICIFIITCIFIPCQGFGNMLGPANIIYTSFERCETNERDIDVLITQRKHNRTTNVLDINMVSPWPINDDIIMNVTAEMQKEGGYKPGSFHIKDTMCTVLSTMLGNVFDEFLKLAGIKDCPIPEGRYEIKNFYLDNENFNVPQIYGKYRIKVLITKGGDLKGCYFVFGDMVPKEQ